MVKKHEAEIAEDFDREFVKGNVPEINSLRCMACGNCVSLCKKLGPNVLEIVDGTAKVVRPDDCIGDGACLTTCPTTALFIMSKHNPESPPAAP